MIGLAAQTQETYAMATEVLILVTEVPGLVTELFASLPGHPAIGVQDLPALVTETPVPL